MVEGLHVAALVVATIKNGRNPKTRTVFAIVLIIVVGLENREGGCRHSSARVVFLKMFFVFCLMGTRFTRQECARIGTTASGMLKYHEVTQICTFELCGYVGQNRYRALSDGPHGHLHPALDRSRKQGVHRHGKHSKTNSAETLASKKYSMVSLPVAPST